MANSDAAQRALLKHLGPWAGEVDVPRGGKRAKVIQAPSSVLGDAMYNYDTFTLSVNESVLITATVWPNKRLYLASFFHRATPAALAAARVNLEGRTLAGLGMQWVKECAVAAGCVEVFLDDDWRNPSNPAMNSEALAASAEAALAEAGLLKRAGRMLNKSVEVADLEAYLERVRVGGYYGQWGFEHNGRVDTADMLTLNASFVDMGL